MPQEKDVPELEADSSPASDDVAAQPQAEATPAESSPATDVTKEENVLSVVRDVVAGKKEALEAASSAEGEEAGEPAGDQPSKKAPDDENFSDVPFHKHPRFQQLLQKSKAHEADAVRYRNVQTFLDENGVGSDEAANVLTVVALAKTDPAKAWEQIKPWVQDLLQRNGEVLAPDLAQRVASGEMTKDTAQEVSRLRAAAQAAETRRTHELEQVQRKQATEAQTSLATTAESWIADRQTKDPNFEAKTVPLTKELAYLQLTEGKPKDAEGVRDQLQRAYKAVNQQIASVTASPAQPRRPAMRPVTGGQVAGTLHAQPETVLDVIKMHRRAG